jgi:hypothetical protein
MVVVVVMVIVVIVVLFVVAVAAVVLFVLVAAPSAVVIVILTAASAAAATVVSVFVLSAVLVAKGIPYFTFPPHCDKIRWANIVLYISLATSSFQLLVISPSHLAYLPLRYCFMPS